MNIHVKIYLDIYSAIQYARGQSQGVEVDSVPLIVWRLIISTSHVLNYANSHYTIINNMIQKPDTHVGLVAVLTEISRNGTII